MNRGTFAGRVGRAAELRYTPDGVAVANFSLAVDVRVKGGKQTLWVDVSLWRKFAETLAPYITTGSHLTVSGKVGVRMYESKSGEPRAALTLECDDLSLQGGKQEHSEPAPAPVSAPALPEVLDDDIPF